MGVEDMRWNGMGWDGIGNLHFGASLVIRYGIITPLPPWERKLNQVVKHFNGNMWFSNIVNVWSVSVKAAHNE